MPDLIYFFPSKLQLLLKLWEKKKKKLKTCFIFSPLLLSPSTIRPPSLPSPPLSHLSSAPCLACPAIAPLLCGLSFVSPAGYSFVPPSSAPFWSGTGIASLCLSLLPLDFSLFPFSCWRLLSMPAVAQCIRIIAGICAVTSAISLPAAPFHLFHSCVHIRVIQCGEQGLFVLVMHAFFRIWVCVCVCARKCQCAWGGNCWGRCLRCRDVRGRVGCVFACVCPSVKIKVELSKDTELLFIRYSIPTARLERSDIPFPPVSLARSDPPVSVWRRVSRVGWKSGN